MAPAPDQATRLLRRVLESAAGDERARVDALIALGQRTLFAALWPDQDKYIRTLTNPAGETAMPLFTGRDTLESAATQLGWRGEDGELSWRELGAREAVRHALARGAHFVVIDLGSEHAIDFRREEMQPLLTRRNTGGPASQDVALTAAVRSASQPAGKRSSFAPQALELSAAPVVPPAAPIPAEPTRPIAPGLPPGAGGHDGSVPPAAMQPAMQPTGHDDSLSIPAPSPPAPIAPASAPPPPSFGDISPEPAPQESPGLGDSMAPPSMSPPVTAEQPQSQPQPQADIAQPGADGSSAGNAAAPAGDAQPPADDAQPQPHTDMAQAAAAAAAEAAAQLDVAKDKLAAAGAGAARGLVAGAGAAAAAASGLAARFRRAGSGSVEAQAAAAAGPTPEAKTPSEPPSELALSDDALDAIAEALRKYPEVEWACCMPLGQGAPEVGLRLDPSFMTRADEISGAIVAAAALSSETLNVNVLDTLDKARTTRSAGTVFFPGRRRARPRR